MHTICTSPCKQTYVCIFVSNSFAKKNGKFIDFLEWLVLVWNSFSLMKIIFNWKFKHSSYFPHMCAIFEVERRSLWHSSSYTIYWNECFNRTEQMVFMFEKEELCTHHSIHILMYMYARNHVNHSNELRFVCGCWVCASVLFVCLRIHSKCFDWRKKTEKLRYVTKYSKSW